MPTSADYQHQILQMLQRQIRCHRIAVLGTAAVGKLFVKILYAYSYKAILSKGFDKYYCAISNLHTCHKFDSEMNNIAFPIYTININSAISTIIAQIA